MITNISTIPPKIRQYFDQKMLSKPMPKMLEGCHTLWELFLYINSNLMHRSEGQVKREKCLALIADFLELYERAKTKEKELEKEETHHTQRPFYCIKSIGKKDERLLTRLTWRSLTKKLSVLRGHSEI